MIARPLCHPGLAARAGALLIGAVLVCGGCTSSSSEPGSVRKAIGTQELLARFVEGAGAGWIEETVAGAPTRYTSADDVSGVTREVVLDPGGRVVEIVETKPPAGVNADDPRRDDLRVSFSGFDETEVELPDDLPGG